MVAVIARPSARVFAFALATLLCSSGANAGIPERLKWVRGTVASVAPASVTIQLRSHTLQVTIDRTTESMLVTPNAVTRQTQPLPATTYLKAGIAVEVHYREGRPTGTARYIFIGIPIDAASFSTGPDRSAAGVISDIRQGNRLLPPRLTIASGPDRRGFVLSSTSQLVDARGSVALARTRLPPAPGAVQRDDRVVVVYRSVRSRLIARLIRVLPAGDMAR